MIVHEIFRFVVITENFSNDLILCHHTHFELNSVETVKISPLNNIGVLE